MRGSSADDHRRIEMRRRAWELRQKGWSQARIGTELGIDQTTVSKYLRYIERRELARLSNKVERQKATQDAILDHLIDEAIQAWERSKKPRTRVTRKTSADGGSGAGANVDQTDVIERDGDPAYLDRARAFLADRRSLWGLDVQAKPNEETGAVPFSERIARAKERAVAYETSKPVEE